MINYIIPDSDNTRRLNEFLFDFRKNYPNEFNDNINIAACYGILQTCSWSGGRVTKREKNKNKSEMKDILKMYESEGVQFRFVFSNLLVEEKHMPDVWGNVQLDFSNEFKIGAIVANPVLEAYIKENYPKVEMVSSVTRGLLTREQLLELLKNDDYKLVVVNTHFNRNLEKIIPAELRAKAEILINDCCPPTCKMHQICYLDNSKSNLGMDRVFPNCTNYEKMNSFKNARSVFEAMDIHKRINDQFVFDEVVELNKLGFEWFKICGRDQPLTDTTYYYARYLIKEEYRMHFICNAFEYLIKMLEDPNEYRNQQRM